MSGRLLTLPFYLLLAISAVAMTLLWLLPERSASITALWVDLLRAEAILVLAAGALFPWEWLAAGGRADDGRDATTRRVIALLALGLPLAALVPLAGAPEALLLAPLLALAPVGLVRDDLVDPLAGLGVYGTVAPTLLLALAAPPIVAAAIGLRTLLALGTLARRAR